MGRPAFEGRVTRDDLDDRADTLLSLLAAISRDLDEYGTHSDEQTRMQAGRRIDQRVEELGSVISSDPDYYERLFAEIRQQESISGRTVRNDLLEQVAVDEGKLLKEYRIPFNKINRIAEVYRNARAQLEEQGVDPELAGDPEVFYAFFQQHVQDTKRRVDEKRGQSKGKPKKKELNSFHALTSGLVIIVANTFAPPPVMASSIGIGGGLFSTGVSKKLPY